MTLALPHTSPTFLINRAVCVFLLVEEQEQGTFQVQDVITPKPRALSLGVEFFRLALGENGAVCAFGYRTMAEPHHD